MLPGYSVLMYLAHRAGLRTTSLKTCARKGLSLGAPLAVDSSTMPVTSAWACAATAEPLEKEAKHHGGAAKVADQRDDVGAHAGLGVGAPAGGGLAVATNIHGGDLVARVDQQGARCRKVARMPPMPGTHTTNGPWPVTS